MASHHTPSPADEHDFGCTGTDGATCDCWCHDPAAELINRRYFGGEPVVEVVDQW